MQYVFVTSFDDHWEMWLQFEMSDSWTHVKDRYYEKVLRNRPGWMTQDPTGHKPPLVLAINWCLQATYNGLGQWWPISLSSSGSAFIKPDQYNPWIKDQIKITIVPTISHLQLPNFVSCGRACPSHMTQNLVTVGAKLWTAERFLVDPWSMDYADPVW